jgi:hypothetical protein
MRILNLQNAVLVSLAVATVALAACSSSDTPRPDGTAGAGAGTTTAGSGNNGTAGSDVIPGAGAPAAGGGDQGGAGAPAAGGGMDGSMAGSGTAGGTAGPSVCDGLGTRILAAMPADAFIDDFECVTAPCTAPKTVADGWSTFADLGKPGTDMVNMEMADNTINMLGIMPGAATTAHGGQYKGTGANLSTKMGFGVGAIYNLVIDPTAGIYCADISAFDGVSFWAKTGIAAGSTVNVNFALPNTNAEVMNSDGKEAGGDCKTGCYNHPHKLVTLSADWMQYTVAFADAAGGSAKVGHLVQLLGFLSPDAAWDFSLDEIAFYKTTPPAGAVAPPAAAAP